MEKTCGTYQSYLQILKEELIPAMGCTEPIALAYGAAKCRSVLGGIPDRVKLSVSGNIIKNVKSVVVPNTNGMKGIEAAVAAGIVAGKEEKVLEVLSQVSEEEKKRIRQFINQTEIKVTLADTELAFDIWISLYKGKEEAKLRIAAYHTNIIYIEKNGQVLLDTGAITEEDRLTDRSLLNVEDIVEFANTLDLDDVREVIGRQVRYNVAISQEGLKNNWGANIGKTLLKAKGNRIENRARAAAAAASDARMSGCELPVVTNSGSGNQGITVSLPVIEFAKEQEADEDTLYRALVVSNLCAVYQKAGIGRLSAYCGVVSAGCGAACGVAYLYGEDADAIGQILQNSVVITSGLICDGAKPSCAGKIASAVDAGLLGYDMYKAGQQFYGGDGICGGDVAKTVENVSRLACEGMKETDKVILDIMVNQP